LGDQSRTAIKAREVARKKASKRKKSGRKYRKVGEGGKEGEVGEQEETGEEGNREVVREEAGLGVEGEAKEGDAYGVEKDRVCIACVNFCDTCFLTVVSAQVKSKPP
jgi:hypothetical protein